MQGSGAVDLEMAQYALERLQIDEHGFDEMDRKLLSTLIQIQRWSGWGGDFGGSHGRGS